MPDIANFHDFFLFLPLTAPMLAEIITIGDELLIGQVVDTNSAWIGQRLNEIGVRIKQITSVSDNEEHILKALDEAGQRSGIILITGGLGPTKDDITKKTLAKFFKAGMRLDGPSLANVERIFRARGREVTELNRRQAEVPENATALLNPLGTAPGMWFEEHGRIYVSLPGVPHEMKGLMEQEVIPQLRQRFKLPPVIHRTILTQGIGESMLSDLLEPWEDALPPHIRLAYLPADGRVRLRLTASGKSEAEINAEFDIQVAGLKNLANRYIYGYEEETMEGVVGALFRAKGWKVATAESCTGGYLSHRLTLVPGSSDYYMGSVIAYDNAVKTSLLGVDPKLFDEVGAVSEPVVRVMAENVRKLLGTELGIAISGIAGPSGGTEEKPVGTVWIAVSSPAGTLSKRFQLGQFRERVIREAAQHALAMTRRILLAEPEPEN